MELISAKKVNGFTFMDPTFPKGTPYRYDICMKSGRYAIESIGSGEANEIIITREGEAAQSDWLLLADDIEIRSGRLAITARLAEHGKAGDESTTFIKTGKRCCGSIFCRESGLEITAVRIVLA